MNVENQFLGNFTTQNRKKSHFDNPPFPNKIYILWPNIAFNLMKYCIIRHFSNQAKVFSVQYFEISVRKINAALEKCYLFLKKTHRINFVLNISGFFEIEVDWEEFFTFIWWYATEKSKNWYQLIQTVLIPFFIDSHAFFKIHYWRTPKIKWILLMWCTLFQ